MSLYQCTKCGCVENTSCSAMGGMGAHMLNAHWKKGGAGEALSSYKKLLDLEPDQEFTDLCSACSVVWFNEKGSYGIGVPTKEEMTASEFKWKERTLGWHGRFKRHYLPKGEYQTCPVGNLEHKKTKKSPEKEDYSDKEFV